VREGQIIANRYRLASRLGGGASGSTWRAEDLLERRWVALKLLEAARVGAVIDRERDALSSALHPDLPALLDAGEIDDGARRFIAMTWFDGASLRSRLGAPMASSLVRAIGRAACEPLAAMHSRGLVHRDIKPEHLLLLSDAPPLRLAIVDLGLSVAVADPRVITAGGVVGTLGYLPPEQLSAQPAPVDPRWDVFSLGCVLFECATGVAPFGGRDAREALARTLVGKPADVRAHRSDFDQGLASLIVAMTSPRSDARPRDAHAARAALDALVIEADDASRVEWPRERYVAVVLAHPPSAASLSATTPLIIEDETSCRLDPALVPRDAQRRSLADGSMVLWLTAATLERAFVLRAIQCALLLAERSPSQRFSVCVSEGGSRAGWPSGPALERALALGAWTEEGEVSVDPVTALWLDGTFACFERTKAIIVCPSSADAASRR
jgi:serine/threonine protein kinase